MNNSLKIVIKTAESFSIRTVQSLFFVSNFCHASDSRMRSCHREVEQADPGTLVKLGIMPTTAAISPDLEQSLVGRT